jgi:hypothetical protein
MRLNVLVLSMLGAVCVGCGGADEPPPAPPATVRTEPSPCDLLTADEIRTVIAEPVLSGEEAGYECTYTRPADAVGMRTLAAKLRLEFSDGDPYELLSRYQTTIRQAIPEYDPLPVAGVGNAAAWDGDALAAAVGLTPTRSAFVSVQLNAVDPGLERDLAQALAERAIAKLRR